MIKFTPTASGITALNGATAGTNPVLIDSIVLYNGTSIIKTITEFTGSVFADGSGIGDYIVLEFSDSSSTAYTITSIRIKSGSTEIAVSETINIVKAVNKQLGVRMTAQFDNADKCSFEAIQIALPYATKFREGVIRLARPSGETEKDYTVYSAKDVETIIDSYISGTGIYVPWDEDPNEDPIIGSVSVEKITMVDDLDNVTSSAVIVLNGTDNNVANISIGGYITGTAVSSAPTISSGSLTGSSKVVNETFISALYANTVSSANNAKLVTSYAVSEYVTSAISTASANYVHLTGNETVAGVKSFTDGISSTSYTGTGVQSAYDDGQNPPTVIWNNVANASKLPTVSVVDSALNALSTAITTAYQNADSSLQSQIDGINAGQNLVDIVDLVADLTGHSLTGLKARGDTNPSGGTFPIGDKIQVLHDSTADNVATVYELVKGDAPYPDAKDKQSTVDTDYYWHYIGVYGVDAYTKSQSDSRYVQSANLIDGNGITSTATTTNAPSAKGVYDFVTTQISGLNLDTTYVKLSSVSNQAITSPITITGATEINEISLEKSSVNNTYTIESGRSGNNFYIHNTSTQTTYGMVDSNDANLWSLVFDSSDDSTLIKRSSDTAISIKPILSGTSVTGYNVTGTAIADYSDITPTAPVSPTDGRLVTVDYMKAYTGDLSGYAKLSSNNTFTGTNTFADISATGYSGSGVYSTYNTSTWSSATTQLPTSSVVKSAISDAVDSVLDTLHTTNAIGSIGLFLYTEVGNEKGYGETVDGSYLKPIGISLPLSGEISYKSVDSSPVMSGTWRLLSVACKRTATTPCLVLAQKVSNS